MAKIEKIGSQMGVLQKKEIEVPKDSMTRDLLEQERILDIELIVHYTQKTMVESKAVKIKVFLWIITWQALSKKAIWRILWACIGSILSMMIKELLILTNKMEKDYLIKIKKASILRKRGIHFWKRK